MESSGGTRAAALAVVPGGAWKALGIGHPAGDAAILQTACRLFDGAAFAA